MHRSLLNKLLSKIEMDILQKSLDVKYEMSTSFQAHQI